MDAIDIDIISKLQGNCRIPNAELARQQSMAASSMLERVRKLEEKKIIRHYRAIIDPKALGLEVHAFVGVSLSTHQADIIANFEKQLLELQHVTAAYHLSGRFDYLLQVVAKNLDDFGEFIKNKIASIKGIGKVESFLAFATVKEHQGLPIDKT